MTSAAKLGHVLADHTRELRNPGCRMCALCSMARFATNARKAIWAMSVAAEAGFSIGFVHPATYGLFEGTGLAPLSAHREIQSLKRIEKAHPAFIKCPVSLKNVGLAC